MAPRTVLLTAAQARCLRTVGGLARARTVLRGFIAEAVRDRDQARARDLRAALTGVQRAGDYIVAEIRRKLAKVERR